MTDVHTLAQQPRLNPRLIILTGNFLKEPQFYRKRLYYTAHIQPIHNGDSTYQSAVDIDCLTDYYLRLEARLLNL